MKKLLALFITLLFISSAYGQPTNCGETNIDYDPVICNDDYLAFAFTVTQGSNNTSLDMTQLPANTSISKNGDFPFLRDDRYNTILIANLTTTFEFNIPSIGCMPVNIGFDFCYTTSDSERTFALIGPNMNNIPTLQQWGIISLGLLAMIFGIARIRKFALQY